MNTERISTQLKLASAVVIGFGLIISLGVVQATRFPLLLAADVVFWPPGNWQAVVINPEAQLLSAILGGVMIGWGVLYWMIADQLLPHDPQMAKRLILVSLGIWFVMDSLGSLLSPAPLNAFFNLFFLVIFAIPLWQIPSGRNSH